MTDKEEFRSQGIMGTPYLIIIPIKYGVPIIPQYSVFSIQESGVRAKKEWHLAKAAFILTHGFWILTPVFNTPWVQRRMSKEMFMKKRHRREKGQRHRGTKALCLCASAPLNLYLWVGIVTLLLCLAAGPCWSFSGLRVAVGAGIPIPVGQPQGVARTSEAFNPQPATGNVSLNPQPATDDDSSSVPLLYELYWIGSISMVVLLIFYFFYLYKKEKYRLVKPLTFLLLFLALSLYLMEQGQTFIGHFDPVKNLFVSGYHEANEIGFLRFIYKLTLGIALCAYGFINFLARQKVEKAVSRLNKGETVIR